MWFINCEAVRVLIDGDGNVEYVGDVAQHECKPAFLDNYDFVSGLNKSVATVSIFPGQQGWQRSLGGAISTRLDPALGNPSIPTTAIIYGSPDARWPMGHISFHIFLPPPISHAVTPHIERMAYSLAPIQMLITLEFDGVRDAAVDWVKFHRPTLEQFRAPALSKEHRPYVSDQVRFAFVRSSPKDG